MSRQAAPLLLFSLLLAWSSACIPPFLTRATVGNGNVSGQEGVVLTPVGFVPFGGIGFNNPFIFRNPFLFTTPTTVDGGLDGGLNVNTGVAGFNTTTAFTNTGPNFNRGLAFNFNGTFNRNFTGVFVLNSPPVTVANQNAAP